MVVDHEATHRCITESSSLGAAASLCGAIGVFARPQEQTQAAAAYLTAFCQQSLWVQEGAATSTELLRSAIYDGLEMGASLEAVIGRPRPDFYIQSANEFLDFTIPLVPLIQPLFAQSLSDSGLPIETCLLDILILATAIAAMSPELDDEWYRAVLLGTGDWNGPLQEIRGRYQRILKCRPDDILAALRRPRRAREHRGLSTEVAFLLEAKELVAGALCEAACLSFMRVDIHQLGLRMLPKDVLEHVSFVTTNSLNLDKLISAKRLSAVQPEQMKAIRAPTLAEFIASTQEVLSKAVLECGGFADGMFVAAHFFSNDFRYIGTALAEACETDIRSHLGMLVRNTMNNSHPTLSGVVVGRENRIRDMPPGVFDGVTTLEVPLWDSPFGEVASIEIIGDWEGRRLVRFRYGDGGRTLQASGVDKSEPNLSECEIAVCWVVQNGFAGNQRWNNLFNRGDPIA